MTQHLPSSDRYHAQWACGEHAKPVSLQSRVPEAEQDIRAQLARLRARHDHGAVSPGVYATIRKLEIEISWAEHRELQAK